MKFLNYFLSLLFVVNWCSARSYVDTQFILSHIENERKPTSIVLHNLCWSNKELLTLSSAIISFGIRVSYNRFNSKYQDHNVLFITDLDCSEAEEVIKNASSTKLFASPYRWLALTNSTNSAAKKELLNSSVLTDSDVVVAEMRENSVNLVEVHRPSPSQAAVLTPRGMYHGTYRDVRAHRTMFRRRLDLRGHTLTMGHVVQDSNDTQIHMEDRLDLNNDALTKVCWMLGKEAILMLNASPKSRFTYRYGYKLNGKWSSGVISDIHDGIVDFGTNCVMTIQERLDVVSFTDNLVPFKVVFVFRQPPLSYATNIYSLPFSSRVWAAVGVCSVVSAAVLCVASRWEPSVGKSATQLDGGISDALFVTMSALSQQGCVMEPRRNPGRITVWWVFATLMALHAAYSANIVTLLQAPSNFITTLPQLVNSKITLAAHDVDYNYFVFKLYNDSVRIAAAKKLKPDKGKAHFYSLSEGVDRMRQGLFALHGIAEIIYRRVELTFKENEKCDLVEIDYMNGLPPYMPMGKHSPYLELVRVALKRIRETGIWSAVNRRLQVPRPRCAGHVASFSSVGVDELKPVLLLMGIGIALAAVILMMEILVHHITAKIEKRGNITFQQ